ncbi:MAG TPA: amidohydrolase family protein [Thermoanaerobaculia bacterium]|jgi:imidazolonepropionase-like amidohydrolase
MKNIAIALLLALATTATLFAAEPEKVYALRAARLIDGRGDAVVSPGIVVVRGNKIVAAGRDAAVPAGAEVIDLGDMTLLPGLIDTHTHILLQGDVTAEDYDVQIFKESLPYRALRASRAVKLALEHGFTTMRDVETEGAMYVDVDVKRAINAGVIPGPRMIVSGRAMSTTGGYGPSGYSPEITYPRGVQIVDGVEGARKAVREQIGNGVDWIKVYADRGYFFAKDGTLSSIPNFTTDEMKAIVDEAHRQRRKVAAHAMARPGLTIALDAGVDSIEHGLAIPDDLLDRMKRQGTWLVPTLTAMEWVGPGRPGIWPQLPPIHRDSFARAFRKGVKIAFGTDAGAFPWDMTAAVEFTYMTRGGMTPMQAIQSATMRAAELLEMESQIGSLEAGKFADVIAVPGNPLEDVKVLERVGFVMKDGVIAKR